jgi:RNA polymerase sigma-70 factor (ECF subfamily)
MSRDLEGLTAAAAKGDRSAIDELLGRYLPDLRAFVRLRAGALVRARESSSDIVQSVCREVLEHMDRFRFPSESAFKRWLFMTALRKISNRRDYWTAQKRDALRERPIAGSGGSQNDDHLAVCYSSFATPSGQAMVREEMERVEVAFEQLSEEHREVITLAHVVGLSRAEIAEQMERSEGAVRVLLHRALARLSELLSTESE